MLDCKCKLATWKCQEPRRHTPGKQPTGVTRMSIPCIVSMYLGSCMRCIYVCFEACDYKELCRMAEVCRKGTQGSVLAWRAASLLSIRLLFVLKPPLWDRKRVNCRVSLWGHDSRSSALLASLWHFSARRGNTRIPYSWSVPLVPDYKNILHCHGISDKV